MANPEHIEWLLEGVENWNRRRNEKYFEPDLSGANIYWKFKTAGMLDNDDFVPLSNINLGWANLRGTIFSRRRTNAGADLSHAILKSANLKNAYLANSKLDKATLQNALLDKANLYAASLCGAKMSGARLYRTRSLRPTLLTQYLGLLSLKKPISLVLLSITQIYLQQTLQGQI